MKACKLIWKENIMGIIRVQSKIFEDKAARMKFILNLEKQPSFVKVLECK